MPDSCCILQGKNWMLEPLDEDCTIAPTTANSFLYNVWTTNEKKWWHKIFFFQGCYKKLEDLTIYNFHLVLLAVFCFVSYQLVLAVIAFSLCKVTKDYLFAQYDWPNFRWKRRRWKMENRQNEHGLNHWWKLAVL